MTSSHPRTPSQSKKCRTLEGEESAKVRGTGLGQRHVCPEHTGQRGDVFPLLTAEGSSVAVKPGRPLLKVHQGGPHSSRSLERDVPCATLPGDISFLTEALEGLSSVTPS